MAHESDSRCPVLDVSGRALHAEAAALRTEAPAVRVLLPGGVVARGDLCDRADHSQGHTVA